MISSFFNDFNKSLNKIKGDKLFIISLFSQLVNKNLFLMNSSIKFLKNKFILDIFLFILLKKLNIFF